MLETNQMHGKLQISQKHFKNLLKAIMLTIDLLELAPMKVTISNKAKYE